MIDRQGPSRTLRFIRCTAGDETYCLRMSWIGGIRRFEELEQGESDVGAIGWIQGEKERIPVFYLATRLHPANEVLPRSGKILILKTTPRTWGMMVDSVDDVMPVEAHEMFPIPTMVGHLPLEWFEAIINIAGRMELALAPEGLHPEMPTGSIEPLQFDDTLDILHSVSSVVVERGIQKKVVLFSTDSNLDLSFGLSLTQVPQILQPLPIVPVPGAASHVLGVVEWRGVPLAVIDLPGCMGGATSGMTTGGRLLIVRVPTQRLCIGLPIRSQVSIRTLPLGHHPSDSAIPLQESLVRGKFDLGDTTLVIPDIDGMLVPSSDSLV